MSVIKTDPDEREGLRGYPLRLSSQNRFADLLAVARNTVVFAYDQMIEEGYLVSVERSGVFVASLDGRDRTPAAPRVAGGGTWAARASRPSAGSASASCIGLRSAGRSGLTVLFPHQANIPVLPQGTQWAARTIQDHQREH